MAVKTDNDLQLLTQNLTSEIYYERIQFMERTVFRDITPHS